MSNIVCFRNYMIVLDSVVVVNLLVFSIYVWVSNFDSTYSSKYSFVFSLLMIRAVGTGLFVFDLSLYLFNMITFYDKKYRALRYVMVCTIKTILFKDMDNLLYNPEVSLIIFNLEQCNKEFSLYFHPKLMLLSLLQL